MIDLIIQLLLNGLALLIMGYLFKGLKIEGFGSAVWVAILLALVNTFIRPVIFFITIPLTVITLGLFVLVINAFMLKLVDWLSNSIQISNFWWALLVSFILALLNLGFY